MPRPDTATEILTIRVPRQLARRLTTEARRQRSTRSAVARAALARGLGEPEDDGLAEARRQSVLVGRSAEEAEVLHFVSRVADLKGWK